MTLLDKFLFDEAMEDTEVYEALLRIILGEEELRLLTSSQTEKELRTAPWLRSIRVDVYAMDAANTIYNTEMQKEWRGDLVKRTRYYQAIIDSSLLAPGEVDFNTIKNTTIIMIMPFDMFGKGRYIYTFEEVCQEDEDIRLNDGAKRVFVNTHGTNCDEVSSEFIALMKYIEYNESANDKSDTSSDLDKIIRRVEFIKASEEVGVRYMQRWEEEAIIRQKAREEGREESLSRAIRSIMQSFKVSAEQAMESLGIPKTEYKKYMTML